MLVRASPQRGTKAASILGISSRSCVERAASTSNRRDPRSGRRPMKIVVSREVLQFRLRGAADW